MAETDCDLIMGFPIDVESQATPPNVQATSAYARTGFVLVRGGKRGPVLLADLPTGTEVGIAQLDTYAGLLFGTHPNIVMSVYPTDSLMMQDIAAHRLGAGLGWQPSIEAYKHHHPGLAPLNMMFLAGPHMVWNLVALYAPRSKGVANMFDQGVAELRSSGRLRTLIQPYQEAPAGTGEQAVRHVGESPFRHAMAWESSAGQFMRVAGTPNPTAGEVVSGSREKKANRKHGKRVIAALYTDEQASAGTLEYYKNCSMCHGPLLDGQLGGYSGPALKGPEFADRRRRGRRKQV